MRSSVRTSLSFRVAYCGNVNFTATNNLRNISMFTNRNVVFYLLTVYPAHQQAFGLPKGVTNVSNESTTSTNSATDKLTTSPLYNFLNRRAYIAYENVL